MITPYQEALNAAYSKMLGSVKKYQFGSTHQELFDITVPEFFKQTILPELGKEPYVSSISETYDRLKQHKWDFADRTGPFGQDKEEARTEIRRLFDNFTGDVIRAMEVNLVLSRKDGKSWTEASSGRSDRQLG